MSDLFGNGKGEIRHTYDMQDIITSTPAWLLRWGITMFFIILVLLFSLSAFIRYPDIVKASIKIESPNSPKPVISRIPGKLIKLLVNDQEEVKAGQLLAYLESTANHQAIINLLNKLKMVQKRVNTGEAVADELFNHVKISEFGELQIPYQTFFEIYLNYKAAVNDGFYLKKKSYLQKDLLNLNKQTAQLNAQKNIQEKEYVLAGQEYEMHRKLEQEKVETASEFREAQSKYYLKNSPLLQTGIALIAAKGSYTSKQKEILELDNQIMEEKAKFLQALNSLISQVNAWKNQYILSAPQSGKLNYAGIVQENEILSSNQEVFFINSGNEQFFGEMAIPQDNMGQVKEGQEVLIKMKSYPFEQYGMIRGKISYIADVPYKDSIFLSKVYFKYKGNTDMKRPVHLKQGMLATAEIITQEATILQRVTWNLVRVIDNK